MSVSNRQVEWDGLVSVTNRSGRRPEVFVDHSHVLHRFKVHSVPLLHVKDFVSSSVESVFGFLILYQHGRIDLIDAYFQNQHIQREPENVRPWLEQHMDINPYWIFNAHFIYRAIFKYILEDDDNHPVKVAIESIIEENGGVGKFGFGEHDVRVVYCQGSEFLWSCGLRVAAARDRSHGYRPGKNVYGDVLTQAAYQHATGGVVCRWSFARLASSPPISHQESHKKTVCIMSDSYFAGMASIKNGSVVAVPGGRYSDVIKQFRSNNLAIGDYSMLVVHCGINDAQNAEEAQIASLRELRSFIERVLVCPNPPKVLIATPLPHPHIDTHSHVERLLSTLEGLDVLLFNWENQSENPFIQENHYNHMLFAPDLFHLNHIGIRKLMDCYSKADFLPHLGNVPYKMQNVRISREKERQKAQSGEYSGVASAGSRNYGKRKIDRYSGNWKASKRGRKWAEADDER